VAASYVNLTWLTLTFGQTLPLLGITAASVLAMRNLNESNSLQSVKLHTEGEHAGKVSISVMQSPLVSKSVLVDPSDVRGLVESNAEASENDYSLMLIQNGTCESTGESVAQQLVVVPGEAWKDNKFMSWLFEHKSAESASLASYHDYHI